MATTASGRCIPHSLPLTGDASPRNVQTLSEGLNEAVKRVASHRRHSNPTVYVGSAGAAYGLALASNIAGEHLEDADGTLEAARMKFSNAQRAYELEDNNGVEQSAFIGPAGVHLAGALSSSIGEDGAEHARLYKGMAKAATSAEEDEVLYGRAGYLLGLLQLADAGYGSLDEEIQGVVKAMVESGREGKGLLPRQTDVPPLLYYWQMTFYNGAAHGLMGIGYALLAARQYWPEGVSDEIEGLVDWCGPCYNCAHGLGLRV